MADENRIKALLDRLREERQEGPPPQRRLRSFHRITRQEAGALIDHRNETRNLVTALLRCAEGEVPPATVRRRLVSAAHAWLDASEEV